MPRAVTITGTRSLGETGQADLHALFRAYVHPFAADEVRFHIGGATGIDTGALTWLAEHTSALLTVAVPCTVADQPTDAVEVIMRWRQRERLDHVVELQEPELGTEAYHARNRWMVDRSDFVIGFPRGTDAASGTWYTLNYAAERGKPRLVVPLEHRADDVLGA